LGPSSKDFGAVFQELEQSCLGGWSLGPGQEVVSLARIPKQNVGRWEAAEGPRLG